MKKLQLASKTAKGRAGERERGGEPQFRAKVKTSFDNSSQRGEKEEEKKGKEGKHVPR